MTLRIAGQVLGALGVCATLTVCTLYVTKSTAQRAEESQQAERNASPIYGITIPAGYRDWRLISVKQLTGAEGKLKQLRAQSTASASQSCRRLADSGLGQSKNLLLVRA